MLIPDLTSRAAESAWIWPLAAVTANMSSSDCILLSDDATRKWWADLYETSSRPRGSQTTAGWLKAPMNDAWVSRYSEINRTSTTNKNGEQCRIYTFPFADNVCSQYRQLYPDSLLSPDFYIDDEIVFFDQNFPVPYPPVSSIIGDYPRKAEMDEISALQAGWDGPESIPPAIDAIGEAKQFLTSIKKNHKLPDVAAGQDGEVNISWRDNKIYVDLSFYSSGGASMYACVEGNVFKIPSGVFSMSDLPHDVMGHLMVS